MVLALLGTSITSAIQLDVITSALFQADFDIKHIMKLENKIEKIFNWDPLEDQLDAGHDERKINKQAYFNELCKVLDPGEPSFTPKKGEQSIVMFVGLQGSGKTTTCREYAYCHQNRGWKPAMVCVDQLKENVAKPTIPFYGSYKESDPVTIAVEGVKIFKEENHDLIIIDASGGHEEEASLFEEMHQLYEATRPDLVIFVMDSSIGQAAFDQAQALKHHVEVGAVILTEGGGGAQSGVAATKSPVISDMDDDEFEILKDKKWPVISHMDEFEIFKVKPFVERLLGLMEKKILGTSSFTFRTLRNKYQGLLRVPARARNIVGSVLGFNGYEGPKVERYMTMIDSMTKEELDSLNPKFLNKSRMIRIARDSGHQVSDVEELLHALKHQAKLEFSMRAYSKRLLWSSCA